MDFRSLERPRVLIVALAGIGNLLMASPLFRALKGANPSSEIDVLVSRRGTAPVVEGNPKIRKVLHGDAKPSFGEWRRLVAVLRRARYDVGIVTHPGQLALSASLLAFGGVRRRIGHRYSWLLLRNSGVLLTDAVTPLTHETLPLSDRSAHDVAQNLRVLAPLGIRSPSPGSVEGAVYDFPLPPDDRTRADAWLREHHREGRPLIGFHPGTHPDLAYKRWPAERWSALGDRLAEDLQAMILVFGGPDERALTAEVCVRMHAPAVPVELPLRATAALIARCTAFVSNDSGLMHVAASQAVPTFGLFGPTDERRTAPWGPTGHVIRAAGTRPTYDVARIAAVRALREPDPSLLRLSVDEVLAAVSARTPAYA